MSLRAGVSSARSARSASTTNGDPLVRSECPRQLPPRRPVPDPPPGFRPTAVAAVPLATIGESIGVVVPGASGSVPVTGISLNSRAVQPGDLYVALPGASRHGADFVSQAVDGRSVCGADGRRRRAPARASRTTLPFRSSWPRSPAARGRAVGPDLPEPAPGSAAPALFRRHGHQRQDHHHLLHQRPAAGPRARRPD